MAEGKENEESHKLVPSCCNCKMVAITGSSGRRKRRFNGLVLLLVSTLGILLALQIPAVSSDGVGGAGSGSSSAAVATSVSNGGVIIRHGRSRGRHSSERRSQQQHPGGSSAADNGAVHPNHTEEEENSASKAVIIEGIGRQGASLSSAAVVDHHTDNEEATIRLETKKKTNIRLGTEEEREMLPYHPHPVRFLHKKTIEAKYKILKLTEKGLTNFKWQQQSSLLHRKHVPEEDTANDVARRRSAVAVNVLNKGGSEDSLIGGKQLSPVRTRLQQALVHGAETAESRKAHGAMPGSANGANNRPVVLADSGWDANGRHVVRTTDAKMEIAEEDKDDHNRTSRNNSKALVTHLHSYLFKTMPRKRQPPQMDRVNAQFQDEELLSPSGHNTSEEVESERPVGAAVDNGQVNKSIISGVDRRLSAQEEETAASADEQGDSTSPEGVNNGQEDRNQMPGTPSTGVIIGSEPNMAKTWKGTDNGNDDNAVTATEETNGPVAEEQLPSNVRVREEKESVGGERKMHNKSSFNSDNSNLNEPSSNATADKRIHADGVMGQHDARNGLMSQRQLELAKRGGLGDNKLEHEEARDMVGMKIEETVLGVGNEIMTTERTWMKTLPEGRAQRNNKSESFADREMNRDVETEVDLEGQTVQAPAGRVNESVPVISGGSRVWEDVATTATTTSTADDKGRVGNKLNKKEAEDEGTPPTPTTTNHRKNATQWKSEIVDESSSAPKDPLSEYLGEEEEEDDVVATNDEGLERMLAEDTSQGNSIELALDDTVKGEDATRNNRLGLQGGYDKLTRFLQTVEQQHLLGSNCTAGTSLNLGEGVVDRYAQERFRVQAEIAVNRANMLTR